MIEKEFSYKKADKLIHGAVKNLTCILPESKNDWHKEQRYAVFWVSHIDKVHVSMTLTPEEIKEYFKIEEGTFKKKLRKDDTVCDECKKECDSAFYGLVRYGEKVCVSCIRKNEETIIPA